MEVIDGQWIAARIGDDRGAKVALANALGVRPDVVSKILSGVRRVQPEEIPKVRAFFRAPTDDEFQSRFERLVPESQALVDALVQKLLEAQGEQ